MVATPRVTNVGDKYWSVSIAVLAAHLNALGPCQLNSGADLERTQKFLAMSRALSHAMTAAGAKTLYMAGDGVIRNF